MAASCGALALSLTLVTHDDRSLVAALRAQSPPADEMPQFTTDGLLMRPQGFEAWVMVGTSTGLSYNPAVNAQPGAGPGMFHNVYLQPWAYRHFKATGKFPEGSMFVLTFFEPVRDAAPARAGFYPGDRLPSFEVHVKRAGLHESGWGFFGFDRDTEQSGMVPGSASCYSCHAKEAKTDHVFTQFYPALRQPIARADGR
jgi:hypothetical protein